MVTSLDEETGHYYCEDFKVETNSSLQLTPNYRVISINVSNVLYEN